MSTEVLSTISERRLRPIYELLDNGNYKKAFHEAEKVLKKQKDLLAAKVLKTIALHRLGRVEEASALACEVVEQEPIDENSLQGLSLYYKECHKTELISPMYEKAIKKCPQNEEYLSHLFMSYVRHDRFQDMQRVAMNLYKQHPKNPYLFWGIMAIVLQAQNVDDRKLAQAMYLPLAEKMIEKHIEKGKIEAEAEVRLYLLVLELLGKHELILKVLNGDLGKKVTSEVVGYTPLSVITEERLGRWHIANSKYKNLLSKSPDVWNYVTGYLDSFFELLIQGWKPPENGDSEDESNYSNGPDYKIEHAYKFVGNLVKQQDDLYEGKCRGPYLMRLELIKRLKARQKTQQDAPVSQASVKQLLLEYALDFSTKPCCTLDLKPYFQLLPKDEIDEFLEELYKQQATFTFDDVTKDFPAKLKPEINKRKQKEFHRHIFTVEATRFLGGHESMSDEKKVKLIELLIKRYQDGICFCDDQCTTDPRIVDNYCLNAIRLLIDLYEKSGDTSLLWRSVMIMEQTLKESQSNYEIKILLMRIYCRLGIFSPCADLYDSLEIKHIQQNTLGYLVCQHVLSLGHYHPASQVFQIARSFFLANTKESYECLISCFRNGTFHKVLEFVEYRRHISNSVQSALTRTEHVLMDLFTQGNIDQPISNLLEMVDKERIKFDQLVDDRDFTVISDVNIAEKQISAEERKESFKEQKKWLKLRELLVQCSSAALSPSKPAQVNGHIDNTHTQHFSLETLVAELEQFCSDLPAEPCIYHFCGPHPSPLHLANSAKYPQNMLLIFRVICSLLSTQGKEAPEFTGISQDITTILDNLKEFLDSFRDGLATKTDCSFLKEEFLNSEISILAEKIPPCLLKLEPNNLEKMVICTEMFSFVVLLLCNLQHVISDAKSDIQRRRRKKKGKPPADTQEPSWIKECQNATESFKTLGEDLASIICKFKAEAEGLVADAEKSYERADDVDSDDEDLPDENVRQLVMKIVRSSSDSITISCKQTHDVIEGRLKNLKGFEWMMSESYDKKYKFLKRKLKYVIYEHESLKSELNKSQRKLLKVCRDNSFLLDRLLQYEQVVPDSPIDSEATFSSDSDSEVLPPQKKKPYHNLGTKQIKVEPQEKVSESSETKGVVQEDANVVSEASDVILDKVKLEPEGCEKIDVGQTKQDSEADEN